MKLLGLLRTKLAEEQYVCAAGDLERYFVVYVRLHVQRVSVTAVRTRRALLFSIQQNTAAILYLCLLKCKLLTKNLLY